jgi:homoserine O-succinyltransferase
MPVTIERPALAAETGVSDIRERRRRRGTIRSHGRRIMIGLVNNMPDAALAATERQFSSALETASGDIDVQLRFYALPQVPRSREALEHMARLYADARTVCDDNLDALIVTGAQPIAANLEDEPYWRGLTKIIDWAEANTISTILSCLAAHAGVRYFSGVARRALPKKCSGVFGFERVRADRLTEGEGPWIVPHSRHNGLDEQELTRNGYAILTHSSSTGVDMFVKQMGGLMVFLQGHLEYERDTLAREYRRDLGRRLGGEFGELPQMPQDYFPAEAERVLREFCARALVERRPDVMASYPEIGLGGAAQSPWRRSTMLFYRNWLSLIADRKAKAMQNTSSLPARWAAEAL